MSEHPSSTMHIEIIFDTQSRIQETMADCDEKGEPEFIQTGFSNVLSHITSNDLHGNFIVKNILSDLLEEKMKPYQETILTLQEELKTLHATLATNQQKTPETLTSGQQNLLNRFYALKQEVAQRTVLKKQPADQTSSAAHEEEIMKLTAEVGRQKKHISQIERGLEKKKMECEDLKNFHLDAPKEIDQLRSTGQHFAIVDDQAIASRLEELRFNIRKTLGS